MHGRALCHFGPHFKTTGAVFCTFKEYHDDYYIHLYQGKHNVLSNMGKQQGNTYSGSLGWYNRCACMQESEIRFQVDSTKYKIICIFPTVGIILTCISLQLIGLCQSNLTDDRWKKQLFTGAFDFLLEVVKWHIIDTGENTTTNLWSNQIRHTFNQTE